MNKDFLELVRALTPLYGAGEARAVAFLLLEDGFGVSRTDIYADKVRQFSADERKRLLNMCQRLQSGCPVQQVVGYAWFCGLRFVVNGDVLIPRPETEELVAWALQTLDGCSCPRVLDAGTGSGCIAVSIGHAHPSADVVAWDLSKASLRTARHNAEDLGVTIRFEEHDILHPGEPEECFDLIVSNPPYVCDSERAEMASHVLNYEPHMALFVPDSDPLLFYRALASMAMGGWLRQGGWLLTEVNRAYAAQTARLFAESGLVDVSVRNDAFGNPRMVGARLNDKTASR